MIEEKPTPFQIFATVSMPQKYFPVLNQLTGALRRPTRTRILFRKPSEFRMENSRLAATTHEIKWGR